MPALWAMLPVGALSLTLSPPMLRKTSSAPSIATHRRRVESGLIHMRTLEWRLFGVEVPVLETTAMGTDYNAILNVSSALHHAVAKQLDLPPERLPIGKLHLVRKSLDARPRGGGRRGRAAASGERDVCWSHVVDVTLSADQAKRLKPQPGAASRARLDASPLPAAKELRIASECVWLLLIASVCCAGRLVPAAKERVASAVPSAMPSAGGAAAAASSGAAHVIVVGAGPCGLFAALTLARAGVRVTLVERGKPVEQRGRSIGALVK